jgi:membrane fusion protein, multidrug efflux system
MGALQSGEFAMIQHSPKVLLLIASLWFGLVAASAEPQPIGTNSLAQKLAAVEPAIVTVPGPISSTISGVSDGNSVRAVVRSVQNVTIGSELNARITKMPFRDGDSFEKGDVLVEFDCARTNAEFDAAVAINSGHQLAYENIKRLQQYEAAGSFAVDQAKFEMQKSKADVAGLEAKRATCIITAPFRGRVVEKMAQSHEVSQANQPLLKIVEGTSQELVLMVPSNWLAVAGIGHQFSVVLDETGQTYKAKVTQVGGAIDPISQSVRMIGELVAPSIGVAPGMSGTASFEFAESIK